MENSLSIEQILREIKSKKGEEFLLNKERTLSICADLAGNQLSAQRNCLKIFMECDGPRCIISLRNADEQTRQLRFGHLVQKMRDEFFVQETAALEMCSIFWRVVFDAQAPDYKLKNCGEQTQEVKKQSPLPTDSKHAQELYSQAMELEKKRDFTGAFNLYLQAAQLGHVDAMYSLVEAYTWSRGTRRDLEEERKWCRKAADRGHAGAQYKLGMSFFWGSQNYAEAVKWYRKSAEQGDARAQTRLGECFEYGKGVPQDYGEAAKWYRLAAEQGYSSAQADLADCYYHGRGIPQNYTEAAKWYLKAAEQHIQPAQYQLGVCYELGQGVQKNIQTAKAWYEKAAANGSVDARRKLESLGTGTGVRRI